MQIGLCRLTFHLPGNGSLKGKRQVSHSLLSRVRRRFNVSAAEVEAQEAWQTLVVGIACVSNEALHANQMLDAVLDFVQGLHLDAELVDVQRETVAGV